MSGFSRTATPDRPAAAATAVKNCRNAWIPCCDSECDSTVIQHGIAVRDSISETCRKTERSRDITIDHLAVGQNIERRRRIVWRRPARIGDPVRREVDALLNGQQQVEGGQIALSGSRYEFIHRS